MKMRCIFMRCIFMICIFVIMRIATTYIVAHMAHIYTPLYTFTHIYTHGMPHIFANVPWLNDICAMTHCYVRHDSTMYLHRNISAWYAIIPSETLQHTATRCHCNTLQHTCAMTHCYRNISVWSAIIPHPIVIKHDTKIFDMGWLWLVGSIKS